MTRTVTRWLLRILFLPVVVGCITFVLVGGERGNAALVRWSAPGRWLDRVLTLYGIGDGEPSR